jgi:hypothetical protein
MIDIIYAMTVFCPNQSNKYTNKIIQSLNTIELTFNENEVIKNCIKMCKEQVEDLNKDRLKNQSRSDNSI